MISSILFNISSSSLVSSFSSIGTGSFVTSSSVVQVIVSFTKESPGRVLIVVNRDQCDTLVFFF
jgi:hypothetical protein